MTRTLTVPLTAVAEFVRSKNAGPFRVTLDVVFRDRRVLEYVAREGSLDREVIAAAYGIPVERITNHVVFTPGKALKATIRRAVSAGSPYDSDVYGAQQHAPLLALRVRLPADLIPDVVAEEERT